MKLMKRLTALALSLLLVLTALSGCMSKGTIKEGIFYDATGVSPDAVLMTVDGVEIPAERYFYWLSSMVSNVESYYGDEAWDQEVEEGTTLKDLCFNYAMDNAKQYAVMENWAKENGLTVSEDRLAEIDEEIAGYQEQYGDMIFNYWGFSAETMKYFYQIYDYYDQVQQATLTEGSAFYPTEEQLSAYQTDTSLMKADHILLATVDLSTGEALSEDEKAAKYATAQDILAQLRAASDPEALFAELADQYSEDPGRVTNPEGYVFGTGEMDAAFEEGAAALANGEISEIVEGSAGYHIILRKALEKDNLLNEDFGYFNYMLLQACEASSVKTSSLFEKTVLALDLSAFNTALSDARNKLYEEYQSTLEGGTENGDTSEGGTGEDAAGGETGETSDSVG